MGSGGVFSAEMPDEPSQAIVPLDADTAERLLSARLDPDDAPPGYAEVARLLQAAAAPADQIELTGQAAAMDAFRTTHPRPAPPPAHPATTHPRPTPPRVPLPGPGPPRRIDGPPWRVARSAGSRQGRGLGSEGPGGRTGVGRSVGRWRGGGVDSRRRPVFP